MAGEDIPPGSILVVQTGGTIDKEYPSALHGYAFEIAAPARFEYPNCSVF